MMGEDHRPTTKPALEAPSLQQGARQDRCLGGRFVLQGKIGAGGGAVVLRARDRQFSVDVAIKLLRSHDAELRRRFAEESEVLRDMDHPAIVRVLAHDRDGDDLYTVLELLEGPDLGERLVRGGPLPWRHVVDIGSQIAGALEAVHCKGLIHRDVKPTNIMLIDADASMRVKLIDFGVVCITQNHRLGGPARRPTDMGTTLGTPAYLPLEAGLVPADARFDVYALGVTLFELLTGQLPEVPLQPLREACPGCDAPEDLGLVLAAALALEPEDRTQSAAELGRALAAVRTAHPNRGARSVRVDGRYERIGLAGTGAKADAYVAVHRGTGHDVVLKSLRSTDPDDALRFAREAKLLRSFDHPALPRFFDYAPEADPPYIAMAHAPGRPASRLCSPPRLKPAEVAAVGSKLAQVLAVVHARGVLHRDINASNVLIDASGAVTLLDFGCAELGEKFYDVPAGERRYLTPPEARVVIPDGEIGRLAWSAPEVHAGRGWTDKSDVYSLGHLLFRLLTGKVPTKGADPPTSPLFHASTCPDELAQAVVSALHVDPRERPGAAQFAEALQDVLETEEEARERVLAQVTQRPPLRLVPALPAVAGWTEHPIPEVTSELPAVAAEPPPEVIAVKRVSAAPTSGGTPRHVWAAAFALATLTAGWSVVHRCTPERPELAAEVAPPARQSPANLHVPRDAGQSPARGLPDPAPAQDETPDPPDRFERTPAGSAADRLTAADEALTKCANQAGHVIFVEVKTSPNRPRFTAMDIDCEVDTGITCVRDVLDKLRFDPPASESIFVKEYRP